MSFKVIKLFNSSISPWVESIDNDFPESYPEHNKTISKNHSDPESSASYDPQLETNDNENHLSYTEERDATSSYHLEIESSSSAFPPSASPTPEGTDDIFSVCCISGNPTVLHLTRLKNVDYNVSPFLNNEINNDENVDDSDADPNFSISSKFNCNNFKKVQDIENLDPNRRSSSSSDSLTKPLFQKSQTATTPPTASPLPKYLWIRLALFEKQLTRIIDFLVSNANKFYDKDALVADPHYGSTLSSLLLGPCALDYSRTKTADHFWTDPPADELVQRHRISSAHSTPPPVRRPILNFRRSLNTSSEDPASNRNSTQYFAKDYVESLHQNSRATLLYGKNNVKVLPANSDITVPMLGYLSLHQTPTCLIIKWTPNQLMNGFTEEVQDKSTYWDYALHVKLDEIVYVHCHQDQETGGTVILVGQDGVQRPPIHFPKGDHMLAFLSCVETGLLPRGRLDPLFGRKDLERRKREEDHLPHCLSKKKRIEITCLGLLIIR
ncbi:hypothetical protein HHI36_022221 [Cryptolaemus montrouzieri]|uniref:RUN domain-containing protein n=1 Tax=Cryptolaemus montrouzieri TaxID=559131 RepID=A0ABD2MZZ8_9CUCU